MPFVERLKDIDWNGKRDTKSRNRAGLVEIPTNHAYSKDWTGKDKELSAFKLHELVRSIPIVRKAKSAHRDPGVM